MKKDISLMNNGELIDEFLQYDQMVNVVGTYGIKDLMILDKLEAEIIRRGGEIVPSARNVTYLDEDDDI